MMFMVLKNIGQWYVELTNPVQPPVWATTNKIILDTPAFALRQFGEGDRSLVIVPPQAGHHSCIADYAPGQSLCELGVKLGYRTFAFEWKSATIDRANEGIDDLIDQLHEGIIAVEEPVDLALLCQAGWLGAMYAARYPETVKSLILAAAPIDFHAGGNLIGAYAKYTPMYVYESLVAMGGGILHGEFMLNGFKSLNWVERYFSDPLRLFCDLGDNAKMLRYRRFRNWYEYTQNIAGKWYLEAVRMFKYNRLPYDISGLECPVTLIAGANDNITLPEQLFAMAKMVKGKVRKILIEDCGHIGCFIKRNALEQWATVLAH